MRGLAGKIVAGAVAIVAIGMGGTAYAADPIAGALGADGRTAPNFNYKTAIRERVFIPQPGIDQDRNGQDDFITADIIRPAEASATNKIPANIDPSPYYTTLCRGNEGQCMADFDNDGVNDRWPLFYDNYFLPRGYAFILGQMNGTAYTENWCPMHGGPGDIAGEKSIVDWLNGRVKGYAPKPQTGPNDPLTTPDLTHEVTASWHNGSSAMIGKSYDGTLSNGGAATGVDGLKTIVPISAISQWYLYSRTGGIRNNTNYPGTGLNTPITTAGNPNNPPGVNLPGRRTLCTPVNNDLNNNANVDTGDGDSHGDINTFWRDRDYAKDASKIKASVFATHGYQDDNVRMDHEWAWFNALKANHVEHKLWLLDSGHVGPFEMRRSVWVETLHRWFDHYLYGVNNGIEKEPAVTIEESKDTWKDYTDWPIPGTQNVDVFLRATSDAAAAGTLGGMTGGAADTLGFTNTANFPNETTVINTPTGSQANRRVFLSRTLTKDVRISGTPTIDLQATLGTTQSNLGAVLVDYNTLTNPDGTIQTFPMITRNGDGVSTPSSNPTDCWGESATGGPACTTIGGACTQPTDTTENACYREITKNTQNVTQWRVTRGTLDSSNRNSLWYLDATPLPVGEKGHFVFPTFATEHTFKAGHRIGIVIVGNLFGGNASNGTPTSASPAQPITLDTRLSKVVLPVLGGYSGLAGAGATDAETVAPVLGAVPADIATTATVSTGKTVTFTLPTATDNEDPDPVVTCDPASGSNFTVGTTTVSCVAKDANGNTSAPKTFKVTVTWINQQNGNVGGSVPATLSLTLGTPAAFGPLTAGIAKDYTAQTTATVISTAGDATLTVADPSSTATGHLVNGTFSLPSALQANAGGPFADVGGSAAPTLLKSWIAPTSNEAVTIAFSQHVGANDALRTGAYSKTLTFTLSTTAP